MKRTEKKLIRLGVLQDAVGWYFYNNKVLKFETGGKHAKNQDFGGIFRKNRIGCVKIILMREK